MDAQSLEIIQEFAVKDILEIDFSPKGTFLSTWQRQSKQTSTEGSSRQEG
jgi:translation initiation factor 2A